MSVCLCRSLYVQCSFVTVCLCIHMSGCLLAVCLCVHMYVRPYVCMSVWLHVHVAMCLYICMSVFPYVCVCSRVSICLCGCVSEYLSGLMSVCLCVRMSMCPFIEILCYQDVLVNEIPGYDLHPGVFFIVQGQWQGLYQSYKVTKAISWERYTLYCFLVPDSGQYVLAVSQ